MNVATTHPLSHRIIDVALEGSSTAMPSAEIEIERHRAISDLVDSNVFEFKNPAMPGPYRVQLGIEEGRIALRVSCAVTGNKDELKIPLNGLKKLISDYVILCDNFYKTARAGQIHRLEAIDAGRRSIHDEGAESLMEALENTVIIDKLTARRLFSLIYVLHMRHNPTIT